MVTLEQQQQQQKQFSARQPTQQTKRIDAETCLPFPVLGCHVDQLDASHFWY